MHLKTLKCNQEINQIPALFIILTILLYENYSSYLKKLNLFFNNSYKIILFIYLWYNLFILMVFQYREAFSIIVYLESRLIITINCIIKYLLNLSSIYAN